MTQTSLDLQIVSPFGWPCGEIPICTAESDPLDPRRPGVWGRFEAVEWQYGHALSNNALHSRPHGRCGHMVSRGGRAHFPHCFQPCTWHGGSGTQRGAPSSSIFLSQFFIRRSTLLLKNLMFARHCCRLHGQKKTIRPILENDRANGGLGSIY